MTYVIHQNLYILFRQRFRRSVVSNPPDHTRPRLGRAAVPGGDGLGFTGALFRLCTATVTDNGVIIVYVRSVCLCGRTAKRAQFQRHFGHGHSPFRAFHMRTTSASDFPMGPDAPQRLQSMRHLHSLGILWNLRISIFSCPQKGQGLHLTFPGMDASPISKERFPFSALGTVRPDSGIPQAD